MTVHDVARMLPDVPSPRNLCRSLAMTEAVVSSCDRERQRTFDSSWSQTEELAALQNASGDEYSIVFSAAGAYVRGFDHASPLTPYHHDDVPRPWPGVLDSVPAVFRQYVHHPAFTDEDGTPVVTVCLWQEAGTGRRQAGEIGFPEGHPDADGSAWLFELLTDPAPEAFQEFAEHCYETAVDLEAVRQVYRPRPLDRALITGLNPAAPVEDVPGEAVTIGYPIAPALSSGTG